jgi:TPP-dependent indolepyruvate ferredoxin oxidoreductase alpha subunit
LSIGDSIAIIISTLIQRSEIDDENFKIKSKNQNPIDFQMKKITPRIGNQIVPKNIFRLKSKHISMANEFVKEKFQEKKLNKLNWKFKDFLFI